MRLNKRHCDIWYYICKNCRQFPETSYDPASFTVCKNCGSLDIEKLKFKKPEGDIFIRPVRIKKLTQPKKRS